MHAKKAFRPEEIDRIMQAMKSTVELPPGAARALEVIEESERQSSTILEELAKQNEGAVARITAQLQAASFIPHEFQDRSDEISRVFEQTQRQLSQAAESARAKLAESLIIEPDIVSRFSFPALPALAFPQWSEIDWEALQKLLIRGVIRLADCGWTAPSWMTHWQIRKLGESTDDEIDDFFLTSYLGDNGDEGRLKPAFAKLLKNKNTEKWKSLLEEVFECIENRRYKVCVPSLLTILEGFTAERLCEQFKLSRRETNVSVSLKRARRHQGGDFTSLMWMSLVVFLEHLFAPSDFERTSPTFINRHWVLHGRSATDWTATDAVKLVNALATLNWLFELGEKRHRRSLTP
jgi:hypothetical protein